MKFPLEGEKGKLSVKKVNNMYIRFFYSSILLLALIPSTTYAFDNQSTHKLLTEAAVNNSEYFEIILKEQLGVEDTDVRLSNGKNTHSITKWLQEGSYEEDEPSCRASNHFHNPLKSWNEAELTDPIWIVDRYCDAFSPFREKYSNISWATGFLDPEQTPLTSPVNNVFAPESDENGRNWSVARGRYYKALTDTDPQQREISFAEIFGTLGYVLHLLQDMAVPAHTRNDFSEGHSQIIGWPSLFNIDWIGNPFEGYVRDHYKDEIKPLISSNISKPFIGEKKLTNFWDTDTHVPGTTTTNFTGQDLGLAEYTNVNFLSYATIFKNASDTEHYFKYPSRASIIDENFPDNINTKIYRDMLAKDGELDTGVYVTKKAGEGHEIKHFLSLRYALYGRDWDDPDMHYLKFKLDDPCYLEYATHLIPRAIGYSATLLDYFFRGKLEISPPDQYVYSVIDGGEIYSPIDGEVEDPNIGHQLIKILKAKVRNNTPDEEMMAGELVAVAKYKRIIGYQADLESGSPTLQMREETFSYSVSEPIVISSLSSTVPEEFTFEFTNTPIPAGITDLYLQVVFKGTLGNETEQAIAVGTRDLREPQHITIWNDTDYFQVFGVLMTAEEVREQKPLVAELNYVDPFPFTETIGFSRDYPEIDAQTKITIQKLPDARYSRIIVIADAADSSYFLTDNIVATWPDFDPPSFDHTWKYSIPTIAHQENSEGGWDSSYVYRVRGIVQHYSLYLMNAYPELYYTTDIPESPKNVLGPFLLTIH